MTELMISNGNVVFQTEGRLLQELGERLVASPEVALVELVKNSYDADSASCDVSIIKLPIQTDTVSFGDEGVHTVEGDSELEDVLSIVDTGHGMTLDEFKARWMTIATSHKTMENISPRYGRRRTGQKGIGRFAVRFLGDHLTLTSIAEDKTLQKKTKVVAVFCWPNLDRETDIREAKIPYKVFEVDPSTPTGTELRIRKLKHPPSFITGSKFRADVLKIVSPLAGLESGRFSDRVEINHDKDPGFRTVLPSSIEAEADNLDIAKKVLDRCWARLTIDLSASKNQVTYKVTFNVIPGSTKLIVPLSSAISNGLVADLRFFPRRAGVFRDQGINGSAAWAWVRENVGVAIIDHGFRIKPYGFEDDDWLSVDADNAHSRRDWRSKIAVENFQIAPEIKPRPKENPALNIATNFQLIGAVFVESAPAALSASNKDLTPSMDREGFLSNEAFEQLVDIVRGGLEFLANEDKKLLLLEEERKAKEAAKSARADFRAAVQYIGHL